MRLSLKKTLQVSALRLLPCLEQVLQAEKVRLAAHTEAELVAPVGLRIEAELFARTAERLALPVVLLAVHTAAAVAPAEFPPAALSVLVPEAQTVRLPGQAVKPLPPEGATDPGSSSKPASSQEV